MGTILIVIGVIIGGIILFAVISGITSAPDIDKQQQWRAKLNASAQALQNRNSATLENILRKIESIDVNIPIKVERSLLNGEWLNMPDAEESFYVSLSTQQIYYKERVIAFNKIINCGRGRPLRQRLSCRMFQGTVLHQSRKRRVAGDASSSRSVR